MSGFIEWLGDLRAKDTRVRAVLRRSLAFDPGNYPPAYPYVEPFVGNEDNYWKRKMLYLVAGLWAMSRQELSAGPVVSLGIACAEHQIKKGSASVERRFVALLDADEDQLYHRLRQINALLKDESIDYEKLLQDLLHWNSDLKRTQNAWARDFYRHLDQSTESEHQSLKEIAE